MNATAAVRRQAQTIAVTSCRRKTTRVINGMKKGADSTGKVMHMLKSGW